MKYITLLEESGDEVLLTIPEELREKLGWSIGDTLEYQIDGGSIIMKTKEETVLVRVDTIQTYRLSYVVEVPKDHPEYALDTVTMNEAKEFSQKALEEIILDHRVVTESEALNECRKENNYVKSWTDLKLKEAFFTLDE